MGHLVQRHRGIAAELGWRMAFVDGQIAGFAAAEAAAGATAEVEAEAAAPPRRIDVAVALHACDTATDEVLARGYTPLPWLHPMP